MHAKVFIILLPLLLGLETAMSQNSTAADSLAHELNEVVVTARQPATRLVGTTLVSTIAGSNLAGLGSALDVLAQLPLIRVEDGAISVTGKSDIEIYIDGRPMRDSSELEQLMSSDIRRVELLMAPGAAYQSTTGAVLKVITRRRFIRGLSLTDRLQVQRRRRWSVTDYLAADYRTGGWDIFASGSVNRDNTVVRGTTTNTLMYEGQQTVVGSRQHSSYPVTAGEVKAGFSYSRGAQSLGACYRYNPERGDFANVGSEWLDSSPALLRDISRRIRAHSHSVSAYYENTFADKYLLHFDGDFKSSTTDSGTATTYPGAEADDVRSTDLRQSSLWAAKLYVEAPLWGGSLTAGTQDSRTHTTLDYRMLNPQVAEYVPSALTDARQTSAALFASWTRSFGPLSLQAGARYEYVDYEFSTDGRRDEAVSRRDHLLTPDLSVSYTFSDDAQASLSYKMATVRPPYSQLTGSLSYTGLHEIEGGNPALRDERMHDLQLLGMWKGFMLQADFTRSLDSYAFVRRLYPAENLQLLMQPVNIDVSALNLWLIWNRTVRCWTPEVTAGMYRQWLKLDGRRHDRPIFSYYFANTVALPGGWTLTANVSGSSQGDMHTNRFGASWFMMDASVGKTFFGRSLTVKVSATDIFNTACHDWTMNTCGISVDKRQSYDRRGVSLSVIWRFHPRQSRYRGEASARAEMDRF